MKLIRTVVLGLKETQEVVKALRAYTECPEDFEDMKTELADCLEESAKQSYYGLNILCRFTEEDFQQAVDASEVKDGVISK